MNVQDQKLKIKPALLTRSEIEWLLGKKRVSKTFEYKLKCVIRNKLKTLVELELPLLTTAGFVQDSSELTVCSKNLTTASKAIEGYVSYTGSHVDKNRARRLVRTLDCFNESDFLSFLGNSCNPQTAKERLLQARKFGHILQTGDASGILSLTPDQRNRAMKSLALLSKFQGCYDDWKVIRQRYDLKWSSESATAIFTRILNNGEESYAEMLKWIRLMIRALPVSYGNIIIFAALTGLRAGEALASIKLIRTDLDSYLSNGMLEHFRYPQIFIRRTKKAFISVVPDNLIELALACQDVSYEGFRAYLKRRRHSTDLKYCRRVFATHLRMSGIDQETIDLLQGRVPKSVFARHYYRPNIDYNKIRDVISGLYHTTTESSN